MVVSKKSGLLIGSGLTFIIMGVIMTATWPIVFHTKIKEMMVLKNGSTSFDIWRAIPIPIYLECYLFNITNVNEILEGKNVPIEVKQMGPYVFRERNKKVNITWNENSTVTYKNQRWWFFEPELSNGSLTDYVTTINPIIATIAYTVRNNGLMLKLIVDMVLRTYHNNLFQTANVSSWLFEGVQDPLLDAVMQIPGLPYNIPFDRFGWFYKRNGSTDTDGLFMMNTGAANFRELGKLEKWQNSNRTIYRGECGEVKGTTGELWALQPDQNEINIFAADLCTHLTLPYSGKVMRRGLEGMQFTANDSLFDNGHKYPNKACYCNEVRDNECMRSGAFNVSACKYGAPAFITLPHLLGVDPYYSSKIKGLEPTENHNFKMAIEPVTGMPLAISAQLQANALVRHISGISINNQLPEPDTLVPMFWFREDIEVNDEYANFAKIALGVRFAFPYGFYSFIFIGISLILCGVYKYRRIAIMQIKETDMAATQKFLCKQEKK